MFKQDYIMTQIREMVNFIAKILFNVDVKKLEVVVESERDGILFQSLRDLKSLVDSGEINEAENNLYQQLNSKNDDGLKLALLFYDYLNSLSEEYLEKHDFTRKEIQEGIKEVLSIYGQAKYLEVFSRNFS